MSLAHGRVQQHPAGTVLCKAKGICQLGFEGKKKKVTHKIVKKWSKLKGLAKTKEGEKKDYILAKLFSGTCGRYEEEVSRELRGG